MNGLVRAWAMLGLVVGVAGCRWSHFPEIPSSPPPPVCVDGAAPPPERACDAEDDTSVDAITDVHSFRVIASAAVCDVSLRCGIGLDVYCHPQYAEWEALMAGATELPSFDVAAGRACVRRLRDGCSAALGTLVACHDLSLLGHCGGCTSACAAEPHCGVPQLGDPCDASSSCDLDLVCGASGSCERAPIAICDGVAVPVIGHLGCACASDRECPETGACVRGVCAPLPFAGAPCTTDGAPCFASTCDHGRCRVP